VKVHIEEGKEVAVEIHTKVVEKDFLPLVKQISEEDIITREKEALQRITHQKVVQDLATGDLTYREEKGIIVGRGIEMAPQLLVMIKITT